MKSKLGKSPHLGVFQTMTEVMKQNPSSEGKEGFRACLQVKKAGLDQKEKRVEMRKEIIESKKIWIEGWLNKRQQIEDAIIQTEQRVARCTFKFARCRLSMKKRLKLMKVKNQMEQDLREMKIEMEQEQQEIVLEMEEVKKEQKEILAQKEDIRKRLEEVKHC